MIDPFKRDGDPEPNCGWGVRSATEFDADGDVGKEKQKMDESGNSMSE